MKMRFLKWSNPKDEHTNGPENDKIDDQKMMYDLELDAQGNIVGGQWRATSTASRYNSNDNSNPPSVKQPDFFWVVPKNNSMYVKNLTLEPWDGRGQVPASWTQASRGAHGFIYNVTREFGFNEKCTVIPENDGKPKEVPCEFKYPRPQPLVNVVNQLVEMSRE
jgi:hypothetical protein